MASLMLKFRPGNAMHKQWEVTRAIVTRDSDIFQDFERIYEVQNFGIFSSITYENVSRIKLFCLGSQNHFFWLFSI